MKTKNIFSKAALFLGICSLAACNFSTKTNNDKIDNMETVSNSEQKIRNGIQWEETGDVKVESAFLMLESGEMISDENTVKPDERFKFVLKISGWKAENGKVQIGAIEQVHDANRPVPLEGADLFGGNDALPEETAKVISLKMGIPAASAIYEVYQTDFKVWNKNADQYITGSYRFKVKK